MPPFNKSPGKTCGSCCGIGRVVRIGGIDGIVAGIVNASVDVIGIVAVIVSSRAFGRSLGIGIGLRFCLRGGSVSGKNPAKRDDARHHRARRAKMLGFIQWLALRSALERPRHETVPR